MKDQFSTSRGGPVQEDGRLSNVELADRIGLSPPLPTPRPQPRSLRRVITGYRAVIDPATVGRGFQVLLHVTMEVKDHKYTMEAFETHLPHSTRSPNAAGCSATPTT